MADNTLVATPEFLFLLAAGQVPLIPLIEFGYELCALYTARIPGEGLVELDTPLTTSGRIMTFLDRCDGSCGIKRARSASRWVRERSRSPRETKLSISLGLPRMRGGQSVTQLELNRLVALTSAEQRMAGKSYYEIDLFLPLENGGIGLEYYGKDTHFGPIRALRDIRRESILAGKGITIHGVTKEQAENVMELERLAKLLKTAQGERWRPPTLQQEKEMRKLLRQLYVADNLVFPF